MKSEIHSFLFDHLSIILGFCLGFWLVARILRQHLRPSVSIAWLVSILFIPYVGVPAYFLFGGRKFAKRMKKKMELYPESEPTTETAGMDRLECIMLAAKMPPIRRGGSIEFISSDRRAYELLLQLIDDAKESIHIMTFILGRDEVGKTLVDHLTVKAREGVKVRLLLDALGCLTTRGRFVQKLRDAGGEVGIFMPVLPLRRKWSANLRNHRKIVIVDGRVAMVGGMNLGKEYMGADSDAARWLDTLHRIEGPAIGDLEEIFAGDWNFATEEEQWIDKFRSDVSYSGKNPSVQIAASGPDVPDEPIHDAIMTACMNADKRIWIVTPYFIPDESIEHAIVLQARLGKDVRVLLPKHPDHLLPDLARGPSLRRLKESGVKIYLYPHGMIHAKYMIVDDDLALSGSMNLDMRSLYLNYEVGVFIRSPEDVKNISDWVESVMSRSEDFDATTVSAARAFLEDLSLLVSPLL